MCVFGIMDFGVTSFFAKAGGISRLGNWVRGERILAKMILTSGRAEAAWATALFHKTGM